MLRLLWWSAVITVIIAACHTAKAFVTMTCYNELCNRVDQLLTNATDQYVNPCDSFKLYTCEMGNKTSVASVFERLELLDAENHDSSIFRNMLESNLSISSSNQRMTNSLKIEREIFHKCTLYDKYKDSDRQKYLSDLPENAKNLELGRDPDTEHWITSDIHYAKKGYGFAFFDFKIVERIGERGIKRRYIQISPPTDNILDISSFLAKRYDFRASSNNFPRKTLLAHKKLKNLIEDFNMIIPKMRHHEEINDQFLSLTDWQNKWNSKIHVHKDTVKVDWKKLISQLFTSSYELPDWSRIKIIVNEENYFFSLIKLLSSTNMHTIENYINLRYISKTIGLVDENYSEYSVIPSITNLPCTPGLFVGTAHAYAMKYFPQSNRHKLKEIFEEVRVNIKIHLMRFIDYNLEAASPSFKNFLWKLDNADVLYAYPSWLLNEEFVEHFYPHNMDVSDRYFDNEEELYKGVFRHNFNNAYLNPNQPIVDIDELFKAFKSNKIEIFEENKNKIVIPIRVFSEANFPFFSSKLYESMNYGSVAATLAYEIYIKLLDTVDDVFDIVECMNSQVPWYVPKEAAFDYKRKATAYLLGLRTAYQVWSKTTFNKNDLIHFKEFGAISNSRLLFFSFAETICQKRYDHTIDTNFEVKPSEFINIVSNMKEFQDAYLCENEDNSIYRSKKCNPLRH